jgi:MFS transporter, DHA1 family, inner membrane transport protein
MPGDQATRTLILILAVSGFASSFGMRIADPLVAEIARDLATDPRTIALMATAFALPYAFIQPVLGPVSDAVGKERIIKVCLAILAVAIAGSALARDPGTLLALRILAGVSAGGIIPASLALIGDRVALEGRHLAISRFLVAIILGQLSGASVSGLIAQLVSWRGVFVLAGGVTAAALVLFLRSAPPAPPPSRFSPKLALERYRAILANPRARALFAFVFVEGIAVFGIFPYVAPILEGRQAGGPFEAGLAISSFAVGGLVYSAMVAFLLRFLGLRWMLAVGGACAALALLVLGLPLPWWVYGAAMAVLGTGFYMMHNSFQTQVTEVMPSARASAVALHAFSYFGGQSLGPVLVGLGLVAIGQPATLVLCALAALAVGLTAAAVLSRPSP